MKNLIKTILKIFIFGFIYRFFINSLGINILDYLDIEYLPLIYYSTSANWNNKNINYINNKNNDSLLNNTSNILRESVKNSEDYINNDNKKNTILKRLKEINNKIKNKYNNILYKINLQKKTLL